VAGHAAVKPAPKADDSRQAVREVVKNRKAAHDFEIKDTYEAGIELRGTEVKSVRQGKINLVDAFARVEKDEVWLYGCDIQPYERASHTQHAARRPRRLLLHAREIRKLAAAVQVKGQTIVALRVYFKGPRIKVEIGVGRGKDHADRRDDLKKKASQREVDRELARLRKR